ncbi:septum formation initiator family protein [Candidatus Pacebacteria bacterium]|nr:septum formation initiator family protein [Candidatus Paceibacterota bacterium]
MKSWGRKGMLKDGLYARVAIGVLTILCIWLALSVYERFTVEREMAERRAVVETEYAELLERKDALEERVEYLRGESGKEAEIRKHFDVAKEGEQVVILVDDEIEAPEIIDTEPEVEAETRPWWKFW